MHKLSSNAAQICPAMSCAASSELDAHFSMACPCRSHHLHRHSAEGLSLSATACSQQSQSHAQLLAQDLPGRHKSWRSCDDLQRRCRSTILGSCTQGSSLPLQHAAISCCAPGCRLQGPTAPTSLPQVPRQALQVVVDGLVAFVLTAALHEIKQA